MIKTANISADTATKIRNTTIKEIGRMQDLEKRRPTKKNLSTKEWKAVKTLAADTTRWIAPADKADKLIRMEYGYTDADRSYGEEDMEPMVVGENTYLAELKDRVKLHHKIKEDPSCKHEMKLNLALDRMNKKKKKKAQSTEGKAEMIIVRTYLDKYKTEGAIAPHVRGTI